MPKNERSATLKAAQRGERHSFQISSEMRTRQVRIIMITGDYVKTAIAIARNIGILSPEDDTSDLDNIMSRGAHKDSEIPRLDL